MQTRKLLKVVKHILEQPERLIMGSQCIVAGDSGKITDYDLSGPNVYEHDIKFIVTPPCKTAGCLAGWTDMLFNGTMPEDVAWGGWTNVKTRAEKTLGLSAAQGDRLFLVRNWKSEFRRRWKNAKNSATRGKILNDYVYDFIETEKKRAGK